MYSRDPCVKMGLVPPQAERPSAGASFLFHLRMDLPALASQDSLAKVM